MNIVAVVGEVYLEDSKPQNFSHTTTLLLTNSVAWPNWPPREAAGIVPELCRAAVRRRRLAENDSEQEINSELLINCPRTPTLLADPKWSYFTQRT